MHSFHICWIGILSSLLIFGPLVILIVLSPPRGGTWAKKDPEGTFLLDGKTVTVNNVQVYSRGFAGIGCNQLLTSKRIFQLSLKNNLSFCINRRSYESFDLFWDRLFTFLGFRGTFSTGNKNLDQHFEILTPTIEVSKALAAADVAAAIFTFFQDTRVRHVFCYNGELTIVLVKNGAMDGTEIPPSSSLENLFSSGNLVGEQVHTLPTLGLIVGNLEAIRPVGATDQVAHFNKLQGFFHGDRLGTPTLYVWLMVVFMLTCVALFLGVSGLLICFTPPPRVIALENLISASVGLAIFLASFRKPIRSIGLTGTQMIGSFACLWAFLVFTSLALSVWINRYEPVSQSVASAQVVNVREERGKNSMITIVTVRLHWVTASGMPRDQIEEFSNFSGPTSLATFELTVKKGLLGYEWAEYRAGGKSRALIAR